MICVAISADDSQSATIKSESAIQAGANYIEIRIDHFKNPLSAKINELIKQINTKLILTVRKQDEGGQYQFDEHTRLKLLRDCITAKPYAIDLESSIEADQLLILIQLAKANQVKVILSFHDFQKTPELDFMKKFISDATKLSVDFVKIIGTAITLQDNLKMLSLPQIAKENNIQLIAFTMGQKGTISRILSPIFGAAFTFAALDKPTAPGQISIREMKQYLEQFKSFSGE